MTKSQTLAFLINMLASASITGVVGADLCLGTCETNANGNKECKFNVKVDLHAGELGYFYFEECEGTNPTLGEFTSCYMWYWSGGIAELSGPAAILVVLSGTSYSYFYYTGGSLLLAYYYYFY